MMNIDAARAGDGLLSPKKEKKGKVGENSSPTSVSATSPDPVFSSEEKKFNFEVPEGWSVRG